MAPRWCEIHSTWIYIKKLFLQVLWNPTCMCILEACVHMLHVCVSTLDGMCAHTRVCVCMLRVCLHIFFAKIILQVKVTRLGLKSILSLQVMLSLENRGLGRKRYKMRCLHHWRPRTLVWWWWWCWLGGRQWGVGVGWRFDL